MKKHKIYSGILWGWMCVICTSFLGCVAEKTEMPTKGTITIVVSETVLPVIRAEEVRFESLYAKAHIDLISTTTREAITRIFNDSIKLIVSSRPLNNEEREVAKRSNIELREYKIALDGIAVIVNSKNPVLRLRTTELDSVFRGEINMWNQLGGLNRSVDVLIPDQNSGEFETVGMTVLKGKRYTNRAKVLGSSPEVLQSVAEMTDAISFVSVNWLKDKDERIKVLEISDPSAPDSLGIKGQYFAPFQAHIYRGYYPIVSEVYIYSKADMYSVGAGFISFVSSYPGQKVVLDHGMVPATMPVRLVELTNRGIKQ